MSFVCLPAVDWEGKKPKQIYVPEENAKPIREELLDMINNDDSDIRDWARSILEPFEICYISKTKEDTNFDNWEPINPWMCVDETEQIVLFQFSKPGINLKESGGYWKFSAPLQSANSFEK